MFLIKTLMSKIIFDNIRYVSYLARSHLLYTTLPKSISKSRYHLRALTFILTGAKNSSHATGLCNFTMIENKLRTLHKNTPVDT